MDLELIKDTPPWDWPRDAGKVFLKTLTDKKAKASDRLIAAELAGDIVVINDALAETLLAILRSAGETDELRAQAAISLGPVLEQGDTMEFDDPDDVPITEGMFHKIQESLHQVYSDTSVPKNVRRRILEASVRASEEWHSAAIETAYASADREWMLTAVFGMRRVRGFDAQILESLESGDAEIHYEAVEAASNWELDAAYDHVAGLVKDPGTPKPLLLAAIGAAGTIRPQEAGMLLLDLADSEDEDIAQAAHDAMATAEGMLHADDEEDFDEDEEDDDEFLN